MESLIKRGLLHPRWVILILSLIVVVCSIGAKNLTFSSDYRVFFSEDNPQLQAFEALQDTYSKDDTLLFVVEPRSGKVFEADVLAAIEDLTEAAWTLPYSLRVDSITNYQHTEADGDDLWVDDLVRDATSQAAADLAKAEGHALAEPLLVNRLINPDASVTSVLITVELPGINKSTEIPELAAAARQMTQEYEAKYGEILDLRLTGKVMNNLAFLEASLNDLQTLVPLAFVIAFLCIAGYMWYASRSWVTCLSGTFASLVVVVVSITTAMGIAGWLGIDLSTPVANAPTMILTLAVADSMHILVGFFHNMQQGKSKQAAMRESLHLNASPVFLTSITTMIGFLSLNFSDAPPFRDLGNITAMGVMCAWAFSLLLLPALMMLLPVKVNKVSDGKVSGMNSIANWVIRHRKWNIAVPLLVLVVCAFGIPRNVLTDVWADYFDDSLEISINNTFTRENLTGLSSIEYSLSAPGTGAVSEPEYLAQIERFANWYRQQPEVYHVNVFTDVMKRLNKNMHSDDAEWYAIPEDRELAAQYLLLYELSLPFGLDLNNQVNLDKSSTRMTVTLHKISTTELLDLAGRAKDWCIDNDLETIFNEGSSSDVMFAHIGYTNIRSMLFGTGLGLLLISLVLVVALRSVKYGALSLLPNIAPSVMAFGAWGLLVGQVGLGLSVVAGMTLGIVVDYTVHFLSKFLRARREQQLSAEEAVRFAFNTVGVALIVTTIILCANFSILAFSDFVMNSEMGLMTAVTIVLALVFDFIFLPAALLLLASNKQQPSQHTGDTRDLSMACKSGG